MCEVPSAARYKGTRCRCDGCREAQRIAQAAYYHRIGGNRHRKPEHETRARANRKAKGYAESQRERDQRRRARKAGVTASPVDRQAIFARDLWQCRLCLLPVDANLPHDHPLSATLDHIIPLALGGPHTPENVQLAHRSCNTRKGAAA